jgi:hypothetical protein
MNLLSEMNSAGRGLWNQTTASKKTPRLSNMS